MHVVDLSARSRAGRGKGYRNRLKAQGMVPGVVYGKDLGSLPIELEIRDVENILNRGGRNTLISLRVNPDKGRAKKLDAIIKDVQYHPFKNEIFHVDFQQISLKEELTTAVPVRLTGDAPGVKAGGRLEQLLREIEVACLPQSIPESIPVDISGLGIGDSLHVADLTPPEGVRFVTDGDITVVTVTAPRVEAEEKETPEHMEPEAPAAAPAPAEE